MLIKNNPKQYTFVNKVLKWNIHIKQIGMVAKHGEIKEINKLVSHSDEPKSMIN